MRQIIKETITNVTLPPKEFTQQIKKIEKECGGRYNLKLQDGERFAIYNIINETIQNNHYDNETQYNIFRLAKHTLWVEHKFKQNFKTYLERHLRAITHPYGNIRVAGRKLVEHIRFGMSNLVFFDNFSKYTKEEIEENKKIIFPLVAKLFMTLQRMESIYQKENIETLDPKDIYTGGDFVYPEETKDKILKSLRKGMEARDVGYMNKIMEYCGYLPLYEPEGFGFCGGRYLPKEVIDKHNLKHKIQLERKKIEKALEIFLSSNKINLSVEYIKEMIYNSDQNLMVENGSKKYEQFWMDIFDEYNIDFSQNLLDLLSACRNHFPHKTLNGKCPEEEMNGL